MENSYFVYNLPYRITGVPSTFKSALEYTFPLEKLAMSLHLRCSQVVLNYNYFIKFSIKFYLSKYIFTYDVDSKLSILYQ